MGNTLSSELKADLQRLARFGANISDAHSCFIFLPSQAFESESRGLEPQSHSGLARSQRNASSRRLLELGGHHSLCDGVVQNCRLPSDAGLIGWVAKHHRSIHVSPFEHDSRTLGIYHTDQDLKSFIGIPISIESDAASPEIGTDHHTYTHTAAHTATHPALCGVIACDSKKAFAFSKIQGKLLENLADEVRQVAKLRRIVCESRQQSSASWERFSRKTADLVRQLGADSVDILRVRTTRTQYLERALGTTSYIDLQGQVLRLVQQGIPEQFPVHCLPHGEIVIVIDNMMSSFYENRLHALSHHLSRRAEWSEVSFEFRKVSWREKRFRHLTLDALIAESGWNDETVREERGLQYGYGRA